MIDLPQLVDVVANPQGRAYLQRDVRAVAGWFVARGLANDLADPDVLVELLLGEAGLR
jgi:RIO kinase 1